MLVKLAEIEEEEGGTQAAIGYYQQAVLLNDSFSPRFYHLAELLVKVGQPEVAKEAALQAVELEPQNPNPLRHQPDGYRLAGKHQGSER